MAELALGAVSLTFQVFSGCIQGYELITDAKHMPSDCQYLRVRLKTEQYRLLDWAEVVRLDETDDNLLISNSSKGLLLDVLDQQRRLIVQFGRLDDKYRKLSKPLLVDYEDAHNGTLPDPPPYEVEEGSPTIERKDSDFRSRFPQSEALLKKSLDWAKKSSGYPKRLKWATFDKTKMENLALKLASFNDFMREMLNTQQLENLAVKQTRTEFQIMQLNSNISNLVQIFEATTLLQLKKGAKPTSRSRRRSKQLTNPVQAYLQYHGLDDQEDDDDDDQDFKDAASAHPSSYAASKTGQQLHNLAALAQFKALNSAIQDPAIFTDEFTSSIGVPKSASETLNVELSRSDIYLLDSDSSDDSSSSNNSENQRVEAFYQPPRSRKTSVWIEWKTYEPPPPFHHTSYPNSANTPTPSGGPDPKIHARVKALAALLKSNNTSPTNQFRAPHCLGYFHDAPSPSSPTSLSPTGTSTATYEPHHRFGLVFEKPPTAHPSTRPLSLHTLLTTPSAQVPSLTHRIALMLSLALALERLHAVNWLHKGLRSANILFFSDCGVAGISWADPFVSGFDYARPALSDDLTEKPPENAREDVYRHPSVQGAGGREVEIPSSYGGKGGSSSSGFKKSFDIYALGIIFLEIAYWAPIETILRIPDLDRAKPREVFRVRQTLLGRAGGGGGGSMAGSMAGSQVSGTLAGSQGGGEEDSEILSHIRSHLGDTLYGVVRACLVGPSAFGIGEGEDEKREDVGARLARGFYERVVGRIGEVRV